MSITNRSRDERRSPSYAPNPPSPPPRQPKPAEKLFECLVGHDRYLFELRDHVGRSK
jgi:hypothetical protein